MYSVNVHGFKYPQTNSHRCIPTVSRVFVNLNLSINLRVRVLLAKDEHAHSSAAMYISSGMFLPFYYSGVSQLYREAEV